MCIIFKTFENALKTLNFIFPICEHGTDHSISILLRIVTLRVHPRQGALRNHSVWTLIVFVLEIFLFAYDREKIVISKS